MYKVVLLRHGESTWNKENRFTGWTDVDLTQQGIEEAKEASESEKQQVPLFEDDRYLYRISRVKLD